MKPMKVFLFALILLLVPLLAHGETQYYSWIISAEDLAIYQQIAPYVRIPLSTIYPDDVSASAAAIDEIIARYASGQISIDNFVNIMDEKARMIFEEGQ